MRVWEKVVFSLADEPAAFPASLREALKELGLSAKTFSKRSRISHSTLYKILSSKNKDIRLSSIREIILAIKEIEQGKNAKGNVIALVADRSSLESVRKEVVMNQQPYTIQSYPAANIEEAMIQGINAERDGVKAIICGPITAYTLEKIVKLPVISLKLKPEQIQWAVDAAIQKIR